MIDTILILEFCVCNSVIKMEGAMATLSLVMTPIPTIYTLELETS